MHRDNGFGPFGNGCLDQFRVEIQIGRININKNGFGPQVTYHLRRGRKGIRGGNDLILRLQVHCFQDQVHGGGAGIDRQRIFGANPSRKFLFKLAGLGAGGYPTGTNCFNDLFNFGFIGIG